MKKIILSLSIVAIVLTVAWAKIPYGKNFMSSTFDRKVTVCISPSGYVENLETRSSDKYIMNNTFIHTEGSFGSNEVDRLMVAYRYAKPVFIAKGKDTQDATFEKRGKKYIFNGYVIRRTNDDIYLSEKDVYNAFPDLPVVEDDDVWEAYKQGMYEYVFSQE